jgi:hypothetical protein
LNAISWVQFLLGITGLGIVYYASVALLYYRQELKSIFLQKRLPAEALQEKHPQTGQPFDRVLIGEVHDLMQKINGVFTEAKKNKYLNNELLYALQLVLRKYWHIEATHFGISINNYISDTAASHCSISFSEDELNAMWKD